MSNKPIIKTASQIVNMKQTGVLLISPLLAAQITALHEDCGKKEWSGVLLFRPINEDRENPENFRAVAEACFPMNYGTAAYTEYDHGEKSLEIFERYPKASPEDNRNPWKLGHIHTHHSMGAYFSGTDDGELRDNANKYPYYLSLVVDFFGTFKAKVAFIARTKVKKTVEYKFRSKWRSVPVDVPDEEVVVTFDLKVKMMLDEWFYQEMEEVSKAAAKKHYSSNSSVGSSYSKPSYEPTYHKPATSAAKVDYSIWEKLRSRGPFLFMEPAKAKVTSFYGMFEEVSKNLRTQAHIDTYVEEALKGIPKWLDEQFAEETTKDIYAEEEIMRKLIDLLDMYKSTNPVVKTILKQLRVYYAENYDTTTTKKLVSHEEQDKDVTRQANMAVTHNQHGSEDEDERYLYN